ncbi:MAG: acyl-CoA thioesterase, partial [Rhodopseudomonas sp.]|uniref:acyl-CoA thioesterase n=1 Tax=Rhodopseudomonas sp. TaxID=1078 RepID=UPI0018274704
MTERIATPPQKTPVLRVMTMPADTNPSGDIFGGWVMAQVDVAGGIAAMQRARGRVATVAVNSFLFKQPISVGDVVSFYVDVVKV